VLCHQGILFVAIIQWSLIIMSMYSKNNFFHFSKEWVSIWENIFFKKTGLGHALQMQCWMCSMSILTTEFCLIIFLNHLDMGGPAHHTLQILTHVTISYGAFWKLQFTKTVHTQSKNWKAKFWQQWSVSVKKFMISSADGHGCQWCTYWKCVYMTFNLSRLLNSETLKYNVCYVVK
jgi:hypothetical protein